MADTHENGAEAPANQPSATGDNVRSTAIPEDPGVQTNPPSGTFFGLNKNRLHSWGIGAAPRNYKALYPPDPYGEEMSDNARIWSIYLNEAADFDTNILAEWRDTIDVLLVFAGLFSAVLTTFVVQTSQSMKPDYNQASMFLLFEMLKATASNGSQPSIPSSPTDFFSPSRSDECLNSLWFVSLMLSLITALVAVLVKQWLHQYVSIAWQVPMIIGLLPVLLHVLLALFFAGLAVFLFSLGMKAVVSLVSIIGFTTYMAYIIALILPVVYPYCPFKVPLTIHVHSLYQFVTDSLIPRIALIRQYPFSHVFGSDRDNVRLSMYQASRDAIIQRRNPSLKEIERDHVQKCATKVDAQSLQWLLYSTSNASVHQSVLQACSGTTYATLECLPIEYISPLSGSLCNQIEQMAPVVPSPGAEKELELYYRARILLSRHHDTNFYRYSSREKHLADRCSNERLKMVLKTNNEEAFPVLLGILQGQQRSSLALFSGVWMGLIDAAQTTSSHPSPRSGAWELELELMAILASSLNTGVNEDVTTIDKPTDEMKDYILRKIMSQSVSDYPSFHSPAVPFPFDLDGRIIPALITRVQERLCDPVYASDRKHLIQTSVTIIEHAAEILDSSLAAPIAMRPVLDILHSWLSSEAFVVVSPDLVTLVHKIYMILHLDY
ncbi:hypothetical protein EDD85DRAFT_1027007 [Armillaria nabsnona]|nr:hypothetical protein EDD85DRAFT_1027007 [Armillaria nabsnona]